MKIPIRTAAGNYQLLAQYNYVLDYCRADIAVAGVLFLRLTLNLTFLLTCVPKYTVCLVLMRLAVDT